MPEEVIGFQLEIDGVTQATQDVEALEAALVQLNEEIKKVDEGTVEFENLNNALEKTKKALKEAKDAQSAARKSHDETVKSVSKLRMGYEGASQATQLLAGENRVLSDVTTKLGKAMGILQVVTELGITNTIKSTAATTRKWMVEKTAIIWTKAITAAQWLWNAAMTANPIGLVVVAVGALIAGIALLVRPIKKMIDSFTSWNDVLDGTLDVLRDIASLFTFGLIDDAATAKTKANLEKISKALDTTTKNLEERSAFMQKLLAASGADEIKAMEQLIEVNNKIMAANEKVLIKYYMNQKNLSEEELKRQEELQDKNKKLKQDNLLLDYAINNERKKREKEAAEKSLEIAKEAETERLKLVKAEYDFKNKLDKELTKENKKELDKRLDNLRTNLDTAHQILTGDVEKRNQLIEKARTAADQFTSSVINGYQTELDQLEALYAGKLEKDEAYYAAKAKLEKKAEKERKIANAMMVANILGSTAQMFNAIAALYEDGSKQHEKWAIAGAIMDGAAAIVGTWAGYASMGIPGTILAAIQTVSIAAMTIAQIKKIKSAASGDGSVSTTSTTSPIPQYNGNTPLGVSAEKASGNVNAPPSQNSFDKLAELQNGNMINTKAYVVSSDMTKQQERDKKLENASRL